MSLGNVAFTDIGRKLAELIDTNGLGDSFWEYIKENYEKNGCVLNIVHNFS